MENSEIKIKIELRNNETGEVVEYEDTSSWDEENGCLADYIWSEGNFSCDCNRELFFRRAKGEKPNMDTKCGDEQYSLNIYTISGDELLYGEFT